MAVPQISVILPVRDGGRYLGEAVASILSQEFRDFELLLVDDHSTDGEVAKLPGSDRRLRILKCRGRGMIDAFETGHARARGRYVARMDADDIARPGRLAAQFELLERNSCLDIAGGCVRFFSSGGIEAGNRHYEDWLNSLRTPAAIHREMFIESPIPNPTAMFRAEALRELGGYRHCEWPEDYDLFLRADRHGMRMGKPDEIVLDWRDHPARLTRTDGLYSRRRFQQAKAHYLARYRLPGGNVLIWGGGPTGTSMHDLLSAEGVSISGFIEVHPRRVGGAKRGKPVYGIERASACRDDFILVAVGARGARAEIRAYMSGHRRREGEHYLFVA